MKTIKISFFYGEITLKANEELTEFKNVKKIEQLEDENFYSIFLGKKTFVYHVEKTEYKETFSSVEIRFMLDENGKRSLEPYFVNLYKGKRIEESFLFDVEIIK